MSIVWPVIVVAMSIVIQVQSQTFKCKANSCAVHATDVSILDSSSTSMSLWVAPDDVIVTQIPDQNPVSCPESNLEAVVSQALRLKASRVTLRPYCLEGLILRKTRTPVLVGPDGPTHCALFVSSANQLDVKDTILDHSECVNATVDITGATIVGTADITAALVLRPRMSRLDSDTMLRNLTFRARHASVAVLLSPPTWDKTLQLDGPSFTGLRGGIGGMQFVALLVAGQLTMAEFDAISVVVLRDPIAGLDRPALTDTTTVGPVIDLWQYMDVGVLMRLRQAIDSSLTRPTCPLSTKSGSHSTTLVAVGFSLAGLLAVCVVILLVHSCRSTEAQDLAPYRFQDSVAQNRTTSTS